MPLKGNQVRMYVCGPTVYWFAHIGNMRAFLFEDVLNRTLAFNHHQVKLIMNITDVGHLTDDMDEGEDKMMVAMRREGKTAFQIADFYTQAFFADLAQLNIKPADEYPKATDHIAEQIEMIQAIERNGFAYITSDGVYFDTSKLPSYGVLSGQKAEEKQAGSRVDMKEKRNATDFALWKFSLSTDGPSTSSGSKREMEWESPWGVGFPGWHIECSAMSKKYLGFPFDIHTGGVDHIAVHHENELAQSVGCCGVYSARFWMHSEFLTIDDGKMSKSLGNLFTVSDLVEKGIDPLAFRYFVLGAHYRTKLNFTWDALKASQTALHRLQDTVRDWEFVGDDGATGWEEKFLSAMNDDLNTAESLAVVWQMIDDPTVSTAEKAVSLLLFDDVLGLGLAQYIGKPLLIPEEVRALLEARDQARTEKNWSASDRLRDEIEQKGFVIEDSADGSRVKQKRT